MTRTANILALVLVLGAAAGPGWSQGLATDTKWSQPPAFIAVIIDTVTVGDPGNLGEPAGEGAGGFGPDRITGAVNYTYNIGKSEVTAGQYTEFLSAVAATDTYALYDELMWTDGYGCKIERSGTPGTYTYAVAPDRANRPVNFVSWGDAARFSNWLTNGQPIGAQNAATTEDGSYTMDGAMTDAELLAITRNTDARFVIPAEDEWHKAAYYDPDVAGYYDYPTGTDAVPSNDLVDPDAGNNANFYQDGGFTIGSPFWTTEVGEFEMSPSPYGTFDQGGNVREWNEEIYYAMFRGARGGAYDYPDSDMLATFRDSREPSINLAWVGFRVAEVPEPATVSLLAFGALAVIRRRRPAP